jgi:hypothetical protein
VVDAETSAPVAGAKVRLHYPGPESGREVETVTTDSQGLFVVPSSYRQHWGVFVGIALNHSLPKSGPRIAPEPLKLEVEHPSYLPLRKEFRPATMGPADGTAEGPRRSAVSGEVYPLTPRR